MKNKGSLVLMEQLLMVLVFAIAAAFCLQAFALSQKISRQFTQTDRASAAAQSAAETLKSCSGDGAAAALLLEGSWDGEQLSVLYDENWSPVAADGVYALTAQPVSGGRIPGLGEAEITVSSAQGELLFSLSAAWQEVTEHG